MDYRQSIQNTPADAGALEALYQAAVKSGEGEAFAAALRLSYAEAPDNLLYAAWYHRLAAAPPPKAPAKVAWQWAIPLGVVAGLLLWFLTDDKRFVLNVEGRTVPLFLLLWAAADAAAILAYLVLAGPRRWRPALALVVGLAVTSAYVIFLYPMISLGSFQQQYLDLMAIHLPVLALAAIGVFVLRGLSDAEDRFAFLIKSLEALVMGGLFLIGWGILTAITFGLFQALGIEPPQAIVRLFIGGAAGFVPVVAVALVYNPNAPPLLQSFDEGLSKLIATLMRVLLPLSLIVLVIYLGFIPFRFMQPFQNRDVLIIYNAMLFAVMALLVGATPAPRTELAAGQAVWLRRGILAVAALALVVGFYAFAAIVYRTWQGEITPNRLTFIGWNIINIGILTALLVGQVGAQVKGGESQVADEEVLELSWVHSLYGTYGVAAIAYAVWTLFVVLAIPWLYRW